MMLLREDHAQQGVRDGYLAISPIAATTIALTIAHQSGRRGDPLIQAFLEAARSPWPDLTLVSKSAEQRLLQADSDS